MDYKYLDGRFFITPLIGCKSNCIYCYLQKELKEPKIIRKNGYNIDVILKNIIKDKRFISGKNGSIISIGAYCDIFPIGDEDLIKFSVDWIIKSLATGNPIQIISKNTLTKDSVRRICGNILYPKQLLYSTTITSFKFWSKIEGGTSNPYERLETLKLFKNEGVPTNVMIKPFLLDKTYNDIEEFKNRLTKDIVDFCVVGELYIMNENLLKLFSNFENDEIVKFGEGILDCTENKKFKIFSDGKLESFINLLRENNIKVFKKSSCVSSNVLEVNNISRNTDFVDKYCLNCGNCSN